MGWTSDEPAQPKEPLPREPIRPGEYVGHRIWSLKEDGLLHSFVINCRWDPKRPVLDTSYQGQKIADYNMVGIWSFKDKDDLYKEYICAWGESIYPIIVGTAWLWGTVIEHEKGYRAQYATIKTLDEVIEAGWGAEKDDRLLEKLKAKYL